jgi:hypothetical protein
VAAASRAVTSYGAHLQGQHVRALQQVGGAAPIYDYT